MLDWKAIDTVLLDMDGTLLDLHFDNHFWARHLPVRYAEHLGEPLELVEQKLFRHMEDIYGTLDWYCLDYWSRYLGVDVMALKRDVAHLIALRPHTRAFLDWLKKQGKRAILITNAHPDILGLKLEKTGIDRWLDAVLSSHDLGTPKEYRRFWEALLAVEHFDPARTLFIDDTQSILEAARDFGIAHVLGVRAPDSRNPDKDFGDLPSIRDFDELMEVHG